MRSFQDIVYTAGHRLKAFLTSWNALIFCFFCLMSTGIWYIHAFSKIADTAEYQAERTHSEVLTEKQLSISPTMHGLPNGRSAVMFPATITITASVNESDYSGLSEADFEVFCTYPNEVVDNLPIVVKCHSKKVIQFHYTPETVEYLIQ